jgi:predicted dehydrogenase
MNHSTQTRRRFLGTVAAGVAGAGAAMMMPAWSYGQVLGSNDRIRVGMIGMGRRSSELLRDFVAAPNTQVVAVCDAYRLLLDRAHAAVPGSAAYDDFRRILDRDDIDAVVIVTPDHWHAIPTVMACAAGKDVFVEKPTAVTVKESRAMVDAARRHNRVVQVGTQQRSDAHFQGAREIVRSGRLGPITFVRTWLYGREPVGGIGNPPDGAPPPGLDWDMWLGPAPRVPFNISRFGLVFNEQGEHTRWATWRYFWDYGGGMMTDWGVHLLDIALWSMGVGYPETIDAAGGTFVIRDNRDTPDTLQVTYRYPGFVCVFENRMTNNHGGGHGIAFHGQAATLIVNRSGYELIPQPGSSVEAETVQAAAGGISTTAHVHDFLEAMRTRGRPIAEIEDGHISSAVSMLGNVAFRTGRQIRWDARREQAIGDAEANRLLRVNYRRPWRL